jgi:hypothetical protein
MLALLNYEVDIPEGHVLCLRLTGQDGDQGWGEILGDVGHELCVLAIIPMYFIKTLTADSTTAALA